MVSADSACVVLASRPKKSQSKTRYVAATIAQHAKRPHCAVANFVKTVGWLLLAEYLNVAPVAFWCGCE